MHEKTNFINTLIRLHELDPMPCGIKDENSVFIFANNSFKKLVNFPLNREIGGLNDVDMPCDTCLFADVFAQQNRQVLLEKQAVSTIDIHNYSHGVDVYSFTKTPLIDSSGTAFGISYRGIPIRNAVNSMLFAEAVAFSPPAQQEIITSIHDQDIDLSEMQEFVLFWLMRSRTSKEIGAMTGTSAKNIDKHVAQILIKFKERGVSNRAELCDYCRQLGWMNRIPRGVLSNPTSIILS